MSPVLLIRKVQNKTSLTKQEVFDLVSGFQEGLVPEYQMSAFLMAIYFQGVSKEEKAFLTEALLKSGQQLEWPHEKFHFVDKHSTGGVGDKTSIILAPLLASLGYKVPMMAGRGLGHTGGTLDKLESLKGVSVDLSIEQFKTNVMRNGFCFIGQTNQLCPADKKLYALRDVTATVSSLPLITASIVSKKIAEGVKGLVYDVKTGSGAFIKNLDQSVELATSLVEASKNLGAKSCALVTDMSQPLGRYAGNTLEMLECFEILEGNTTLYNDTTEVTLQLCAHLMSFYESAPVEELYTKALNKLKTGQAFEILKTQLKIQGWSGTLPESDTLTEDFCSPNTGYISTMDTEKIGWALVELGAGRKQLHDQIDPAAGFYFYKKKGDKVETGEPLIKIYYTDKTKKETAKRMLSKCFQLNKEAPVPTPLIHTSV